MSCITTQKSGGHIYYKLSESKRVGNKVENTKVSVGKFDEKNKCIVIYDDYRDNPVVKAFLEKQKSAGLAVKPCSSESLYTADDIRSAAVLSLGEAAIMQTAAEKSGLADCVYDVFGRHRGGAILTLAMYMAVKGEPLMYCRLWLESSALDAALPKELDSRRITDLLRSVTMEESDRFYSCWCRMAVAENDYLALDMTSHSTWSDLMGLAGYGYNRDHDSLAQVNSCLVCGEKSRLPIVQETYEGEIKDVSTLRNMLSIHGEQFLHSSMVVTDKGFASGPNIAAMLEGPLKMDFLTSLPFVMNFPSDAISEAAGEIDRPEHTMRIGSDILQGMALPGARQWPGCSDQAKVHVFVYHNRKVSLKCEEELNVKLSPLCKLIRNDPEQARQSKDVLKYFKVRKKYGGAPGELSFTLKDDAVQSELAHKGWLVCISSRITDPEQAILIYRDKDVTEKGHFRTKDLIGLHRLRVHTDESVKPLLLAGFLALVLQMWVHIKMDKADLYKDYTMREMFRTVATHIVHVIKGNRIVSPATSKQKVIYKAMECKIPS